MTPPTQSTGELEELYKILDTYYVLKNKDELGVEPENKLVALIHKEAYRLACKALYVNPPEGVDPICNKLLKEVQTRRLQSLIQEEA